MSDRLPIIVLGGSDAQPGPVPVGLDADEMLHGFKGAIGLEGGGCLAGELIDRIEASGRFTPPILVGPRRVYEGLLDAELCDVEGNLAATLAAVRQLVADRFDPAAPVAIITCDILPTADDLCQLMADCYDPHSGCHFWGQLVEAEPPAMGASGWKPSYRFLPEAGRPEVNIYPGHLVVARPAALRIRLANHLLQLAYGQRNRELRKRYLPMIARGAGRLMWEDLCNLFRGQAPKLTLSIPYYCLRAFRRYRRGALSVPDFAAHVSKVFLHRDYQHDADGRPVVFSLTPLVSFAKDIDTKRELTEMLPGAQV